MVKQNELLGFESKNRFYEIGSMDGIKDLSEYLWTLLNLGLVNGSEIKYDGYIKPIENNKNISNCFWL